MIVAKSGAGQRINCPTCDHLLTVPPASEFTGDDDDEETGAPLPGAPRARLDKPEPNAVQSESVAAATQDGSLERELANAKRELVRQQTLFKKAVDECERQTASATHAHAELKSFQSDRSQLKAELAHTRQRALAAENHVAELTAALETAKAQDTSLREQLENDLSILRELQAVTETQLTAREVKLRDATAKCTALAEALASAQAESAGLQACEAALRRDLETVRAEAAEHAQLFTLADQELHAAHARLQAAGAEHERLAGELEELREQVQTQRRDLLETDSGREMLDLRQRVHQLDVECQELREGVTTLSSENQSLLTTADGLEAELLETRRLQQEAEIRAETNSEARLNKDNEVLRGIVARQNKTLGAQHSELRKHRRARFALHIFYTIFGIVLLGLIVLALQVFYPQALDALLSR